MKIITRKLEEDAEFMRSSVSQFGVGRLEISNQMDNGLGFSKEITIYKDNKQRGWGEEIFDGTLAELIDRIENSEWQGVTA